MDKKTYKVIAENGIMANGGTIAPGGFINLFPNEPQTIAMLEAHSIVENDSTEEDSDTKESIASNENEENTDAGEKEEGADGEGEDEKPTVKKYKVLNAEGITEENGTTHAEGDEVELDADADGTKTWIENGSIQEVTE